MKKFIFLLEETSMKEFLKRFLPRAFPGIDFLCIKHEGKQDLEKSIPRKLKAWGEKEAEFIIIRDNDNAECIIIKKRLQELCRKAGCPDSLIRLACQELESWYLGSLLVLAEAYNIRKVLSLANKSKYRYPDQLSSPSNELKKIIPWFGKIECARKMGMLIPIDEKENFSQSFKAFVRGLRKKVKG